MHELEKYEIFSTSENMVVDYTLMIAIFHLVNCLIERNLFLEAAKKGGCKKKK